MSLVVGIDEAGVGSIVGPLVIAAAAFKTGTQLPTTIKDSKKLSAGKREKLVDDIFFLSEWIIIQRAPPAFINRHQHIWEVWDLAMEDLLDRCKSRGAGKIIVDGSRESSRMPGVTYEAKADDRYPVVSAASIIAKFSQTCWMEKANEEYPKFRFDLHKGYPTAYHKRILIEEGPTEYHRLGYEPVRKAMEGLPKGQVARLRQLNFSNGITTTFIGAA